MIVAVCILSVLLGLFLGLYMIWRASRRYRAFCDGYNASYYTYLYNGSGYVGNTGSFLPFSEWEKGQQAFIDGWVGKK